MIRLCEVVRLPEQGLWRCPECGHAAPLPDRPQLPIRRACRRDRPPRNSLVGLRLAELFHRIGFDADGDCGCAALAAQLNQMGPAWCRDNLAWIVARIEENARRTRAPFSRWVARWLVLLAARLEEQGRGLSHWENLGLCAIGVVFIMWRIWRSIRHFHERE